MANTKKPAKPVKQMKRKGRLGAPYDDKPINKGKRRGPVPVDRVN